MLIKSKIVDALNEQIGRELFSSLQYLAIGAHFDAESLPELSAFFYRQAEEEKEHALRFMRFIVDTGARVKMPAISVAQSHFPFVEDAIKLSLQQEIHITDRINELYALATKESDYLTLNFLQWFLTEQIEEVASMEDLLHIVQRAGEANMLNVEEYLARKRSGKATPVKKDVN